LIKRLFWDSKYHRITMLWRLIIQIVLFMILTTFLPLVVVVIAGLLLGLASGASTAGMDTSSVTESPGLLVLLQMGMLLGCVLSVWLAGRFLDRRRFRDFGLRLNRDWWIDFAFGLGLGALLMNLIFLIEWVAGWITIAGTFHASTLHVSFTLALILYMINFVAVGILEELFSRGYQLKNMAEGFTGIRFLGTKGAIILATILSSALFGYLHAKNPNATTISTFNIFLAGVFLAMGILLTGELAIPIGLHITWNFFQGKVFGFPVSGVESNLSIIAIVQGGNELITGGDFGPEAGLIGVGAMILGSILIVLWIKMRHGRVGLRQELTQPDLLSGGSHH
jgi:membrane protease YdiL (CAAX protease family)